MGLTITDPAFIFLDSAKDFDTASLSRSTRRTLEIILPWCQAQCLVGDSDSSATNITKDVYNQAVQYAQAIDLSVLAAHNGFTVAEDATSLLELMRSMETTAEERSEYLEGTLKLAQKGRANALAAKNKFVNVRSVIESLVWKLMEREKTKTSIKYQEVIAGKLVPVSRPLSDVTSQLLSGIHHLEEFRDSLTQFVGWWNLIEMETKTQIDREQQLVEQPTKMKMNTIEVRWNNHRVRYASYVNEIGIIQDHYPALFAESRRVIRNIDDTPTQSDTRPRPDTLPPSYTQLTSDPLPFTVNDAAHSPHDPRSYPDGNTAAEPTGRPSHKRTESSVMIGEELNSTLSYVSAKLNHVQILEPGRRAFLMLHFQCHCDLGHRVRSIKIKWKFRSVDGALNGPEVVDVAPKQSIGAHTGETRKRNLGVSAPAQVNVAGATFGPEFTGHWERSKIVERAMVITGSVRGLLSDSAQWTVAENASAKAGVPSHFCVGLIVNYDGPFKMELMLDVKQVSSTRWWRSHVQLKSEVFLVDADSRAGDFEKYGDPKSWRDWFHSINGEIRGTSNIYNQLALRKD